MMAETAQTMNTDDLDFRALPGFARFILHNYLQDYVLEQMRLFRQLNFFLCAQLTEDEFYQFSVKFHEEVLQFFAGNKAKELVEITRQKWLSNHYPFAVEDGRIEDICTALHVRKQGLMKLLPAYTPDAAEWLEIIKEIDRYVLLAEKTFSAYYLSIHLQDKQQIIHKIQQSEELSRQAQALAHIGNYTWDLKTNIINWSDELYRIYEIAPQSCEINYDLIYQYNHPADVKIITEKTQTAIKSHEPFDFTYRIILPGQQIKVLHARGEILVDELSGQPYKVIGTAGDVTERENLINRLKQSEELYKQAQQIANIGNWSWDVRANKVTWSEELYRIFEREPGEEIDYAKYLSLIHPGDVDLVSRNVQNALSEHKPYDFHHRLPGRDGTLKVLHSRGEALWDAEGKVYKLLGTAQDVTKQHHIQQQLRENQNFIQKIADATPSIIASYNVNTGRYRFISGGLEKLLGYDPRLPLEQGVSFFMNILHPDDVQMMMEKNAKALELANAPEAIDPHDFIVEFQYRMRHKKGEYRWFHTYGTIFDRNAEGKVEHVLNISLDITERKKAEAKVREQEHFIQHIADASPTILYVYDLQQNKIDYINQEIRQITGYSVQEIMDMGNSFRSEMYHPEDFSILPERNERFYQLAKEEGAMFRYECRMKAKNADWRWLLVGEVIYSWDEVNGPLQVLGAAIDISDRKAMEQALQQKNLELKQSNKNLEDFAYVASHDLQEPLRKISVFGQKLHALQNELSTDNRFYLKKIIDSTARMQKLIDDLLVISRISYNKSFQVYSLQAVLVEVLQLLDIKEKQYVFINPVPLPEAHFIPAQFRQLFQNLISNSLKFARTGVRPKIDITWKYLSTKEAASFNTSKRSRYIRIDFSDNGIGFENEFADRIFVIFQRLHGRSEYEGTGIGLAICKKIAENHGGVIFANGNPEKGAIFSLIIPE